MRRTIATLAGLLGLATVSAQAAPNQNSDNRLSLGSGLSFALGRSGLRRGPASPTTRLARRVVLGMIRPEPVEIDAGRVDVRISLDDKAGSDLAVHARLRSCRLGARVWPRVQARRQGCPGPTVSPMSTIAQRETRLRGLYSGRTA